METVNTNKETLEKLVKLACEHGWLSHVESGIYKIELSKEPATALPQYDALPSANEEGIIMLGSLNDILFGDELGFIRALMLSTNKAQYLGIGSTDIANRLIEIPESERIEYLGREFL